MCSPTRLKPHLGTFTCPWTSRYLKASIYRGKSGDGGVFPQEGSEMRDAAVTCSVLQRYTDTFPGFADADCLGKQTEVCKILISTHFLKVSKLQDGDSTENAEVLQGKYFNLCSVKCCQHFCGRNTLDLPSPHISQSTEGWYSDELFLPPGILAFLLTQTCTKAPLGNKTTLSG